MGANNFSQFTYDGRGHVAKIVETVGGTVTSTKQFVWCAEQRCESRDAAGALTARYFKRGETIGGTAYYFFKDHLGSTREMFDGTGTVKADYDFDPFGNVRKDLEVVQADMQYAGYYIHVPSGLLLTSYRAYCPSAGRWISRDPIQESGGLNLYQYVGGNPVLAIDALGLKEYASIPIFKHEAGLDPGTDLSGGCVDAVNGFLHLPPGGFPEKNVPKRSTDCFYGALGYRKAAQPCCDGKTPYVWGESGTRSQPRPGQGDPIPNPAGFWDPAGDRSGEYDYVFVKNGTIFHMNHGDIPNPQRPQTGYGDPVGDPVPHANIFP